MAFFAYEVKTTNDNMPSNDDILSNDATLHDHYNDAKLVMTPLVRWCVHRNDALYGYDTVLRNGVTIETEKNTRCQRQPSATPSRPLMCRVRMCRGLELELGRG